MDITNKFRVLVSAIAAAGAVAFTSCDSDNESADIYEKYGFDFEKYSFTFDSKTNKLVSPNVPTINADIFEDKVVGAGWEHITTREVKPNGKCKGEDYYYNMVGVSPKRFYVGSDSITSFFSLDTPAEVYQTNAYLYSSRYNSFVIGGDTMQVIQLRKTSDVKSLVLCGKIAEKADGTPVYAISIYESVLKKVVDKWKEDYKVNYDTLSKGSGK